MLRAKKQAGSFGPQGDLGSGRFGALGTGSWSWEALPRFGETPRRLQLAPQGVSSRCTQSSNTRTLNAENVSPRLVDAATRQHEPTLFAAVIRLVVRLQPPPRC